MHQEIEEVTNSDVPYFMDGKRWRMMPKVTSEIKNFRNHKSLGFNTVDSCLLELYQNVTL